MTATVPDRNTASTRRPDMAAPIAPPTKAMVVRPRHHSAPLNRIP